MHAFVKKKKTTQNHIFVVYTVTITVSFPKTCTLKPSFKM